MVTEPHLRHNILVTRRLPPGPMKLVLERCEADVWEGENAMPRDELLTRIKGKTGAITLLTERVDGELLDAAGPDLVIVANYAVGFDNVDVEECTRRRVLVSNTPDVLTETTADLAWTLLMTAARRVAEGDRFLRNRTAWIWAPEMMLGQDIHGKVLGVVGFGRIGQSMARRASGFGMRVVYYDVIRPSDDVARGLGAEYRAFDDLLGEADLISIHVALTPETRHLFGAEQFRKMKPTAVLVNTSRGPVIDEAALVDALREGEIFGAGLDVFENEPEIHPGLLDLDNAVLIPHLGSATVETRDAMGFLAVENLLSALEGRRPPTMINPRAWEARAGT
ncbi:MAG TPA: D-glycerate dehydrogenase [Actinomycetota bacterium]|nr:D-glycerate dehydrogenase [Actinomycetota bacterium]